MFYDKAAGRYVFACFISVFACVILFFQVSFLYLHVLPVSLQILSIFCMFNTSFPIFHPCFYMFHPVFPFFIPVFACFILFSHFSSLFLHVSSLLLHVLALFSLVFFGFMCHSFANRERLDGTPVTSGSSAERLRKRGGEEPPLNKPDIGYFVCACIGWACCMCAFVFALLVMVLKK